MDNKRCRVVRKTGLYQINESLDSFLRTEFRKAVASKYGLECGKSHESNHLEEVKSHLEELKTKLKVLAENMDGLEQKI